MCNEHVRFYNKIFRKLFFAFPFFFFSLYNGLDTERGGQEMKQSKWGALAWGSTAVFFALSLWFSASAVINDLTDRWGLTEADKPWVSAAVPAGFAAGALISAVLGISDRFPARKLFMISALAGALANSLLLFADHPFIGILLRFVTGAALAGVYPVAVKVLTLWFPKHRGLAIGIVIGALTLGSALPHLLAALTMNVDWRGVILLSSILSVLSAVIMIRFVRDAPQQGAPSVFSVNMIGKVLRNKPVMLANYGYFGHMWELYAMWTWLPLFMAEGGLAHASFLSFVTIGLAGAAGCVLGGLLADKVGRARLTIWAMGVSAVCTFVIGFTFEHSLLLMMVVASIWGCSIIADSAQFSAAVSEFAEGDYLGTALTFQMSIGFLLTIISINLVSWIQVHAGWEWAFFVLGIGPVLGIASMHRLRNYEEAAGSE